MRRLGVIAAVLIVGLVAARPAAAASITYSSQAVIVGDQLTVPILISGADDLVLYDLSFAFNPAVLSFVGATEGPFLSGGVPDTTFFFACPSSDPNTPCAPDPAFSFSNVLLGGLPGVSGEGVIATLIFTTIGTGDGSLTFPTVTLLNSLFEFLDANLDLGTLTVSPVPQPVPEPATIGLVALGLGALARRRRRSTSGATD
jgi:hypothetical protein